MPAHPAGERLHDGVHQRPFVDRVVPDDVLDELTGAVPLDTQLELWDMPALFVALLGLIAAEWLLRRRRGLA